MSAPPYCFQKVYANLFRLETVDGGAALRNLCDRILNTAQEGLEFEPIDDFVHLDILHYPLMGMGNSENCLVAPGVSQQECCLRILVAERNTPGKKFEFIPFIFVSDPISTALGRLHLGYPKRLSTFAYLEGNQAVSQLGKLTSSLSLRTVVSMAPSSQISEIIAVDFLNTGTTAPAAASPPGLAFRAVVRSPLVQRKQRALPPDRHPQDDTGLVFAVAHSNGPAGVEALPKDAEISFSPTTNPDLDLAASLGLASRYSFSARDWWSYRFNFHIDLTKVP